MQLVGETMAAMGRWLLVLQGVELVMRMGARLVVLLVGMDGGDLGQQSQGREGGVQLLVDL